MISTLHTESLVVSLHGMGGDGASLSNGTTQTLPSGSAVERLATEYARAFFRVTLCNAGGPADIDVELRLCGTTNVQGRDVNGEEQACTDAASSASGRFVHLEHSRVVRAALDEVTAAFLAALEPIAD